MYIYIHIYIYIIQIYGVLLRGKAHEPSDYMARGGTVASVSVSMRLKKLSL